jgi:hypothetical protein
MHEPKQITVYCYCEECQKEAQEWLKECKNPTQ